MGIFDFLKTQNTPNATEAHKEVKDERKAECPNCAGALEKVPGAKTKCPHCGEFMLVRTRPDNVRLVLTEKQANEVEQMKNFLNTTGIQCDITVEEIMNRYKQCLDMNNTLWSLSNEYLLMNQKSGNFDNIISLYKALERIRVLQEKSANYLVKRRMDFEMLRYKDAGLPLVIAVSSHDSCDACMKLDGKEYEIDEAIKNQPIPPESCTCLRCSITI